MFLWFYSLLMRQERGVSGCTHWCGRAAVHGLRVIACARALSHLPTARTHHVITESWPWRSGPQREVLYSWSFKGSHQGRSNTPSSYLTHRFFIPLHTPRFLPPGGRGLQALCCHGWRGRWGQRCLLEVRFRQWAHLIGPSGRVTWHN